MYQNSGEADDEVLIVDYFLTSERVEGEWRREEESRGEESRVEGEQRESRGSVSMRDGKWHINPFQCS